MRLFGHPVHPMLVHFPVALWPAHAGLHLFARALPPGTGAIAFWLLAAGTTLAWLAAFCGLADLIPLAAASDRPAWRNGLTHGLINGGVTAAFTAIVAIEYATYPDIQHGHLFMAGEIALLVLMFVGNYFGGAVVWSDRES